MLRALPAMNFKFECPHCRQRIAATIADAGSVGTCPTCQKQFMVPEPPLTGRLVHQPIPPPPIPATASTPTFDPNNLRRAQVLWLLSLGGVSLVATLYFLTRSDSAPTSSSSLSAPPITRPHATPIPKSTPREASPDEQRRLASAIQQAKRKVDLMLRGSRMDMDIAVTEKIYFVDGRPNIDIHIQLLSADAIQSFKDRSLRRDVYPTLQAAYREGLMDNGFSRSSVLVYTDVTK